MSKDHALLHTGEAQRLPALLLSAALLLVLLGSRVPGPGEGADRLRLRVVSSPPEFVSGGDARIEVLVPTGVPLDSVVVEAAGADVTGLLSADEERHRLKGVLRGLSVGESRITARAGGETTSLVVVNHPRSGPLFSGPPQEPFFCATEEHRAVAGLGDVLDDDCRMETVVGFVYLSDSTDRFEPFDPDGPRPPDLAQTTTTEGETVDFVVRWERGTINRFIYSLAVLSPEAGRPEAGRPDDPGLSAWNEKLIYYFQGGVGVGHYQGEPSLERMLYRHGLSKGYAVAYSTGTKTGVHYDLEVGGETAIMVKSRFVTDYGEPAYTVGVGGSGGGIQQYVYGQNHEGLLDAAIPQYSYPDMVTQTIHVGDCELLERYMDAEVAADSASKWARWSRRTWLEGMNASDTLANPYRGGAPGLSECVNGWRGLTPLTLNPHYGTAPGITPEEQAGVVWTHAEDLRQIYGRAADGYAARAWDNVGVQYGLEALLDSRITPEEFLDLNARAGSWKDEAAMVQEGAPFIEGAEGFDPHSARNMRLSPDDRGRSPAPRAEADPGAIDRLHRHGMVFTGDLDIPVMDWRHYLEPFLDMHNAHQSFAARARMLRHDGDASNQVIWFTEAESEDDRFDQTPMAFEVVDAWMANLEAHPERGVAGNKPEQAVDACFDAGGALIYAGEDAWAGILDDREPGPCTARFPVYGTSRTVAGGPITGDVFKCSLQSVGEAIAEGVYGAWVPSPEQEARLEETFPQGVCDYAKEHAGRP